MTATPSASPILQETMALFKVIHGYQRHLPKLERYTLWRRMEDILIECIETIVKTRFVQEKGAKMGLLTNLSANTDVMKMLIRLALETKCIDQKKYPALEEKLLSIGRMVGGWIKYTHTS